ncbi:YebG family protein [Spongiibacter sp.]|uniref:YebG family protein n=1 Tax=Spongiibacter sp. TaxID=2024860 RepID=UPI0035657238
MAVVAKWMCDRDNTMFDSKKDADAYDKMLELAEQFSALLQREIPGVDDNKAEEFGILLAKNKDSLVQACKGKVEVLESLGSEPSSNVQAIAGA